MSTPAGWYPDPKMPGTQRFWDGERWSDHVAPAPTTPRPQDTSDVVMVLGILAAMLVPLVGFIIGLTQINRPTGWVIVALSFVCFGAWWLMLADLGYV